MSWFSGTDSGGFGVLESDIHALNVARRRHPDPDGPLRRHVWSRIVMPALLASLSALMMASSAAAAPAASATKTVSYDGYRLVIPRSWAVYRLAGHPGTCVRFDRHALYLGRPSADQRCPSQTVGRTEAILVSPRTAIDTRVGATLAPAVAGADGTVGSVARINGAGGRVDVTATWRRHPATIARALRVRSLGRLAAASRVRPSVGRVATIRAARSTARAAAVPAGPGQVYTGAGFDVCSTPSARAMSAWAPAYRAAAVYIGGANMACAQPNLTATWATSVSAAGWHLIPIYVGLQAPGNSCGCAAISGSIAGSEGTAAAQDAVVQAQARGLGRGNPVYFDMEAYRRGGTNTTTAMTFLAAWTNQLHAVGYKSGIYSSDGSGIADLVARSGTGYPEPDDIWIANWNNARTTSDPVVPADIWAGHQRIHQFDGDHNETHGGVTLNVDGDYVDAATAAVGGASIAAAPPQPLTPPSISGAAVTGQTLSERHGLWSGAPVSYAYQWETCPPGAPCTPIPGATGPKLGVAPGQVGARIRVLETASNSLGTAAPATSAATGPVLTAPGTGYWLYTGHGNVYSSANMGWYGSAAQARVSSVTGMAVTADGRGYWLVSAAGRVFASGDAARLGGVAPAHPVAGMVAAPGGGYWLFTSHGNVYSVGGAPWFGSAAPARVSSVTGMAVTADGRGYWLVTAAGRVFAYGDAGRFARVSPAHPAVGIVAAPGGGYWLFTSHGNVYSVGGAAWFGSAAPARVSSVTGMAATADGGGYWLVTAAGRVFAYGDAARLPAIRHAHPIIGLNR